MADKKLFPVSIDLLYDGMEVPYDIFDASREYFLLRRGKTIRASQIESIRNINGGKDIIYVSQETYKMMMAHNKVKMKLDQERLEVATQYNQVKYETLDILQEMEETETVCLEKLHTVSDKLSDQLEDTKPDLILDLINALAPVDEYLQRHCVNVSLLNGLLGKWMNLPKEAVDTLVLIGLLHDCGKAAMPRQIMSAPRPLTVVEFEVVKLHPVHSYKMLTEFPELVRLGARGHHEKYNGSGYPDGLKGVEISLMSRVTAVSDIYDAMTARRSYKDPNSPFFVLSLLRKLQETELDPMLVDVFIENMPKELLNKPVVLTNGDEGVLCEIDYENIEYPKVKVKNRVIKCNEKLKVKMMQ